MRNVLAQQTLTVLQSLNYDTEQTTQPNEPFWIPMKSF
jgi:hypothetical protein